jgi:hypothetical protein
MVNQAAPPIKSAYNAPGDFSLDLTHQEKIGIMQVLFLDFLLCIRAPNPDTRSTRLPQLD